MLAANLPVVPSVELGSMQAYALASMRNYAQMAILQGCTPDQVLDVAFDGIERATAEPSQERRSHSQSVTRR